MKTILVTGAAGFIGNHCARGFLDRGDRVVGLDNINDYYDPSLKELNLKRTADKYGLDGNWVFCKGDIRDAELVDKLFEEHQFDGVLHLAAMAGVRASIDQPHLYWDVNLTGTLNLLEAARKTKVGVFAFASTSSVYGDTKVMPFVETDMCDHPLAPYAASKRATELLAYSYHHLHGMNCNALRYFTVYGPWGRPDMMALKVLDNMHFGRKVVLFNNGQMHRDWTYIDDIVQGSMKAVDTPVGFEAFNIGRGEPVLLADFIAKLEDLSGKKANLEPAPMMKADVPYTYANIDKARTLLGYEPTVAVEQGLEALWDWYRDFIIARGKPSAE